LGGDGAEGGRDGQEEIVVSAGVGFAQEKLHFAPHHLDGIQIGRVSGQETDLGSSLGNECERANSRDGGGVDLAGDATR